MSIKKIVVSILVTSFLYGNAVSASASGLPLKVALIESSSGSKHIVSGDYSKFINNLPNTNSAIGTFENNMGLCAAYIKTNEFKKSEVSCTAAINNLKLIKLPRKKSLYLKALSLSNRAVSRYLSNDISGSKEDFTAAISVDSNPITKYNLALVKDLLITDEEQNLVSLSD
jgi:hypothetical protein